MAICPECLSQKPFFARRCSECNEEIGIMRQAVAMYIYYSTAIFGFWFFVESLVNVSFSFYVIWYWFLSVAIPTIILWILLFLYFWITQRFFG